MPQIVRNRINTKIGKPPREVNPSAPSSRYLLMVSTVEPRKNHETLVSAWERLRASTEPDLKLVLVGAMGWNYREIVRKFLPWIERGELKLLEDVPSNELRQLYRHAAATVCPSVGEGFDFSGIERCAADRLLSPPHQGASRNLWRRGRVFHPYDSPDAAHAIERVIAPHPSGAAAPN